MYLLTDLLKALMPTPVRISALSMLFSTSGCLAVRSCSFLPSSKQLPSFFQFTNTVSTLLLLLRRNMSSSSGIASVLCSSPGNPFISASFIGNG